MRVLSSAFILLICLSAELPKTNAESPANLVVVNGKIVTVDSDFTIAEAVAIRDGRFVMVGKNSDAQKFVGEKTRVIDAHGRTVIPGLLETHVHATGAARGEVHQPFVQLGSIPEIQQWIRDRTRATPHGTWIQVPRVDVTRIAERRIPTRADLDEAAAEHPVVFNWQYANRQVQVLNSAALRAAGITAETKAPNQGHIQRTPEGELTGVLENSGSLIAKYLTKPDVTEKQYLDSLEKLLRRYNELGITAITERNSSVEGFRTYQKLKAEKRLPVRVTVTIGLRTDGSVEGTEQFIRSLPFKFGEGDEWVKVGPLKIGVDGGILYGTAFLREPYGEQAFHLYRLTDSQYRGDLRFSPEKLANIIRTGHRLGWQMSSHVTGDAGVDAVLDAIEAANEDSPIAERRYNLIHAYFPHPDAAQRAARLGVCVDTQPAWYYKDGDAVASALGGRRLSNFIGVAEWQRAGVKVALNSDHMNGFDPDKSLNPFNPFLTMYVAISRKTEAGQIFGADQRISRADALRMMTRDAAYLSFDEVHTGSIEVGKFGDLAILTDDLLNCDEERIKDIRAAITVVNGDVVYDASKPVP